MYISTTRNSSLSRFFIFNVLLINFCFSQSISWQKVYGQPGYGEDYCNEICIADGNNFYCAGSSILPDSTGRRPFVLKVNEYGDTIWSRFIYAGETANTICRTPEGGAVITGNGDNDSAYAVKINPNGGIAWQKSYAGGSVFFQDILNTGDGGFILCGYQGTTNTGIVFKIDYSGNLEWQKLYNGKSFFAVQEAFDSGYILGGNSYGFAYLLKTDYSGNQIWDKTFSNDTLLNSCKSILKLDNRYLISGNNGAPLNNLGIAFIKTDLNGNILFSKNINTGSTHDEYYYFTAIRSPNRYVFCFERDSIQTVAGALITDSNGNVVISKKLNYPNTFRYASTRSAITCSNGDIIFGGISAFQGTSYDFYLVRTDSNLYSPPYIGIEKISQTIPGEFRLKQNYPNPFNPTTTILFELPRQSHALIKVYDLLGREVKTLVNEILQPGIYKTDFISKDLCSGVYIYCFFINGQKLDSKKMILIK